MKPQSFDPNDILHEPSDEQFDAPMEAVATEARKHAPDQRALVRHVPRRG
jgi:hypothetical protein